MQKVFNTIDLLSVTTGRLLSEISGVYEVMEHLVGSPVWTHQLPRLMEPCAGAIKEQFPALDWAGLTRRVGIICEVARGFSDNAHALPFIAARVDEALREMSVPARLPISPMDGGVFFVRDPVEEAEDMAPGRVLSVRF